MKVLVTGASGFVGSAIVLKLCADNRYQVSGSVRKIPENQPTVARFFKVPEIDANTDWGSVLSGVDTIIHTAARVHVLNDKADDPLSQYREVNVEGTLNLARQAVNANVKRFVFISSIKVNGEFTLPGKPFTAADKANPSDPYSVSKWEAEVGLKQLATESGLEVVIIRPPLVYGPGVKANFQRMMRWISGGAPLPLGSIDNKRSLVGIDNLVDLIVTCIEHPAAANQIFMAADGQDCSTTEMLRAIGRAFGKPVRLYPCPVGLLLFLASLVGQKAVVQRLTRNLQLDISRARSLLGWEPPVSLEDGLRRAALDFIKRSSLS